PYEGYVAVCEELNRLTPGNHEKRSALFNSGAEAVENAVKIARYHTGRSAIVTFDHAFHGRTLLAMSLTAKVMPYKKGMGPFAPEIYRLPFAYPYRWPGDPERVTEEALAYAIDEMHTNIGEESIAAVIMEPIQGEGGFIVPSPGFVQGIAEFCAGHGIVFIADEIQSGMGRAGRWYAIEDEHVVPDLVTTAKSIGAGMPISAVTGRSEIMDAVHPGGLGGTYGGNPVAAAASLAVLDKIEREDLLARSRSLGARIMSRLDSFASTYDVVGDVRGRGAMCAIELVSDRVTKEPLGADAMNAIARRCLEQGVLVLTAGTYGNVVRLLPPITIDDGLLDDGLDVLDSAMGAVTT
ncbi:MAG: aminotransferase class III-fold pyridoxal phosphate-dependent enzyme, partial [Actinobacteria bacterium]|nr:aminotransferase class III-fold pyridoxal phosphate-dependent enzyme [Actinomycetota bacterium]